MEDATPAASARSRETASWSRARLIAVTRAPARARAMASEPQPEPISATVMPGRIASLRRIRRIFSACARSSVSFWGSRKWAQEEFRPSSRKSR